MSLIRQRACTFRYRVIEVLGVTEIDRGDETAQTAYAGADRTREFKTLKGAMAYHERLAAESHWPALLQVGCVQWLSEGEAVEWAEAHKGDFWE